MPPAEYFIRLQHGIVGGFAPPTPDSVYTLTKTSGLSNISITTAVRPDGTPALQDGAPTSLAGDAPSTDTLVDELYAILQAIPVEQPTGSEDIYGLNTSIAWVSEGFEWFNGGPAGTTGGTSAVQPTEGDRAKFKRAVEIVKELVGEAK
ncbi:unnamed protein product [Mycena citricolor]|uniref:Uncharacterized protein n=1 Tax=Mycena citricolor TaxID=2018698 RepID=A0AAD2HWD0_9AGAR|nr:unnamed protein product [Mycena citricolor]CAK5282526.1 unnamed protein product [Mycena citricolor]